MSEALPKLVSPPLESRIACSTPPCNDCTFKDRCARNPKCGSCTQRACSRACNDCGGGLVLQFSGTNSCSAVCCKAPLGSIYADMVMKDEYAFTKRPRITFKQKGLCMHHGLLGGHDTDIIPPGMEMVGVNLRHVWSSRGWHSRDLRDYLRIPKGVKLLLFSCTYDPVLDNAWDHGVHHTDFESLGFDHWEVYEFSQYATYSHFFNNWLGYRSLWAGEASGSHFCQPVPWTISSDKDKKSYRHWSKWAKAVPQMTVNWQFTALRNADEWRWNVGTVRRALRLMPDIKSIWFQGVASYAHMFNLRMAFPSHDIYFLSSDPWVRAQHRREFDVRGGGSSSPKERLELLLQNQVNYVNLVLSALRDAEQELAKATQTKGTSHG